MDETCTCAEFAGDSPTCPVHTYLGMNVGGEIISFTQPLTDKVLEKVRKELMYHMRNVRYGRDFKPFKKYERKAGRLYVEIISMDGIEYRPANWIENLTHRNVK